MREDELEASSNPFSKVVLAYLKSRQTQGDPLSRHAWKIRLARGSTVRGFGAKDVRELFLDDRLDDGFAEAIARYVLARRGEHSKGATYAVYFDPRNMLVKSRGLAKELKRS